MESVLTFAFNFNRSYLLPGSGTRDVKLLATKSNVFYSGQWMFKIGWPNMGALNVEAADSFLQKEFNRPLYFIVDQCKKQPTRKIPAICPGARFSKVLVTFRARKAVLCLLCLHLR